MRKLTENEKVIIAKLLTIAECHALKLDDVTVEVIDNDTGTLRSSHLKNRQRVKAVSDTHFTDDDGGYVEVILFVDAENNFGELNIWKADGTALLNFPRNLSDFGEFKAVSK